ncbi:hypothetical protein JKY72_00705 [Candidatus Gracilibacteria bacterium]|nr:hypothetical protein [Candidatus Gracilibacteria bacterium]
MIVKIWKGEKDSNERCITKFNKRVQASRKIPKVRSGRYHKKSLTRRQIRAAAIMREHYRAIRDKNKFY